MLQQYLLVQQHSSQSGKIEMAPTDLFGLPVSKLLDWILSGMTS
jgi:hypothetical protein